MPEPIRGYADTSVFGGVFDDEFKTASEIFFREVDERRLRLVVSRLVEEEIVGAPERVQTLFKEHRPQVETNAVP